MKLNGTTRLSARSRYLLRRNNKRSWQNLSATVIATYTKVAFTKLYNRKNALVAADILNDRVLPGFESEDVRILRILTDRGTEYCGRREDHAFELYLAIEDIDHSRTKAKHPQRNNICDRFHLNNGAKTFLF